MLQDRIEQLEQQMYVIEKQLEKSPGIVEKLRTYICSYIWKYKHVNTEMNKMMFSSQDEGGNGDSDGDSEGGKWREFGIR